jgi:hypothetical protein
MLEEEDSSSQPEPGGKASVVTQQRQKLYVDRCASAYSFFVANFQEEKEK